MSLLQDALGVVRNRFDGKWYVVCAEPVRYASDPDEPIERDAYGCPRRYCGALIELPTARYDAAMTCGHPERHMIGGADAVGPTVW